MEQLQKLFGKHQMLAHLAEKFTLLIDEKRTAGGVLFFLHLDGRTYKVMIAAPYHESILKNGTPTIKEVLEHKEAMYLK
ncbi:hypothetical protein [Sphingobacterium griseoflavum]|uniref:Uncharacterized protein n=1 Tax=Sphingobacterium griseoflavum TaxID=1474952 RepID=A0ABQ3HZ31_9SPHI|nr:hypothetical protein [Sphingobacterium griseoflavum]GHE41854.1 hypothetical protein GCM10017764_26340 [Sphingobacterium griseoflavum]